MFSIFLFIALSQIENEYDHVRGAFRDGAAERYINWAGNMALGQKTGVPWIMCEQKDAPGEVVTFFFPGSLSPFSTNNLTTSNKKPYMHLCLIELNVSL